MARRRAFYPIDTSDRLANVVVSSIATLIVALLALILWMTSTDDPAATATSDAPPGTTDVADGADAGVERVPAEPVPTDAVGGTAGTADTEADGSGDGAPGPADGTGADGTDGADAGGPDPGDGAGVDGTGGEPPARAEQAAPGDTATETPPGASTDGSRPDAVDTPPATVPPPAGSPPSDSADGGGVLPSPGRGSRLFSSDDPDRIPAISVQSAPKDVMTVDVDLDGDGAAERVWAAIVRDQVITRIDRVVDGRWEPGRERGGAPADRLVELRVEDLTNDRLPEVYTTQWVATEGESITLWSVRNLELVRMPVTGGCWSDTNTFGLIGARVVTSDDGPASVVAVCKSKPQPTQQWPSALYRWRDGRWVFDRLLGKYE
ncbi:MAG: hypothetical protein KY460_04500 [Actinobacteria bacterium]|nr:hypothetical protein [Actinomycetota bacterium]